MPRGTLSEREPAGGGLFRVRLIVDEATAATHTRHGQYIEIRHDDGDTDGDRTIPSAAKGFFAIASAPGERTWDILVRDGGTMGERLRTLSLGERVILSDATGPGFPVETAHGRPLIVAVTGSAIAAVLSTLGARIEDGDAKHTFLFYGVRDRSELGLQAELDAMRAAGIDVAICLSREHVGEHGFYRGYVQDVALSRHWGLAHALIFAAGNEAMIEGMREAAPALGLTAADVRVNA
jgi:NAD(P)H-flavin reductase